MRPWLRRLLRVRDTPEALARGLAVGFFFGVSVFWGLQMALAMLVSWLVRGNKVVAVAATAVSNPLTTIPLYGFSWLVGRLVLGDEGALPDLAAIRGPAELMELGPRFLATMLVGTTIVGLVGGAAFYFGAPRFMAALRRWHGGRARRRGEARTPQTAD
ncbi:MAG TPA: DUF2062 domain-containing protein [Anaeromyxobacter sp.]|nr:DUF2062 domain-containing protein [Anaeromyxobacter sp.]